MTVMVLVVLAAIWAGVLLPPYLQKRRATSPSSSVVDFHQQLAVLQRTGRALHGADLHEGYADQARPLAPQPPHPTSYGHVSYGHAGFHAPARMSRQDVLRRRRDVFATLVFAALLTFVLALALGGSVWLVHLLVDAALLGYVALLMQLQQQRRPAVRPHVAYLPQQQSATQQALLRRQAN